MPLPGKGTLEAGAARSPQARSPAEFYWHPASVIGPRSAANEQGWPSSEIPFSMQALARSIGRRGLPQAPARNGLMPEPANSVAARERGLRSSPEISHRDPQPKKASGSEAKRKALSKKEQEARKRKAAQRKKHGFWW
ncbi:hypothetical protein [Methylacidimicrobium sp. B4]|uniref:hypothetical protein n=1 Tax=Methylacidimicrobium sp. B4 TaxID=2796139 RepID=UPI001A8C24C0|nr:hypothetical protein [Methylacidimicrobium sp. B4]QSR84574.1 hypothetical protein MacB4_10315 [Methylacidimicrobium sp. B4]